MANELCNACHEGYHAPFERFHQVAVNEQGPTFLMRCEPCEALWHETLHDARIISAEEAAQLYLNASLL